MKILLYLILVIFFRLCETTYNPFKGTTLRSISRSTGSNPIQVDIDLETSKDFLVIGYFKRLQPINEIGEGWFWAPIQFGAPFPKATVFMFTQFLKDTVTYKYVADNNQYYKMEYSSCGSIQNVWFLVGLGFSDLTKKGYFYLEGGSASRTSIFDAVGDFPYSGLTICIACQYALIYNIYFGGLYSHVNIIKGQQENLNNFNYINYYGLSTFALRTAYFPNSDIDTFILSQNSNFSTSGSMCSTGFVYFDGVCITESGCQQLYLSSQDSYGAINNSWVSDHSKCVTCNDNCSICTSSSVCSQCDSGYALLPDTTCQKCSSSTYYNPNTFTCVNACPLPLYADLSNNICTSSFDPIQHTTGPFLNKVYFQSSYGFQIKNSVTSLASPSVFASCWLDFNAYKPHSFLGGISFSTANEISQIFTNLPKSPIKIISFIAFVLDSSTQNSITVKINSQIAQLLNSTSLNTNQSTCEDDQTNVKVYLLNYKIVDSSTQITVQISSSTIGWGIRQLKIQSIKCHPTCVDCFQDGSPKSCIQSAALNMKIYEESICTQGQYIKHDLTKYNPPSASCNNCKSNCLACEDLTGICTSCDPGYLIRLGNCIRNTFCYGEYEDDGYAKHCQRFKDLAFEEGVSNTGAVSIQVTYATYNNAYNVSTICDTNPQSILPGPFHNNVILWKMLSQYRQYHYSAYLNITIGNSGIVSAGSYLAIDLNNVIQNQQFVFPESSSNNCSYTPIKVTRKENLRTNRSVIRMEYSSSSDYFFSDIYLYLGRCHHSCKLCSNVAQLQCDICIDNATISLDIDRCQCNIGYYMSIDQITEIGQCLKCNSACNTCEGPSFLDCTGSICADGYIKAGSDCAAICSSGEYWDKALASCQPCDQCCSECYGPSSENCRYCANSLTYNNKLCNFNSDSSICSSCAIASGGYCGGTATNHQFCKNLFWVIYDSTTCVNCQKASSSLCGKTLAFNEVCSKHGYYYSASNSICKNCSIANQQNCGVSDISQTCQSQLWIYFQYSTCINCTTDPSFHDPQCDVCQSTCNTCNGPTDKDCTSCIYPKYLYTNSCIEICPNGWKENTTSHSCQNCIQLFDSGCQKCHPSCKTCSPQQISSDPSTCSSCWSSRVLVGNTCYCSDSEDTRLNYLECSKENIAVLDIILSNTLPQMIVNFGKELINLSGYTPGENSSLVCAEIFSSTSLQLIGSTSTCQISTKLIIVTLSKSTKLNQFFMIKILLGNSSTVSQGSEINFQSGKLKFKNNSSSYITVFLNNLAIQQLPLSTIVEFSYKAEGNSCDDYAIENSQIINDSQRGYSSILWTLEGMNSLDSVDQAIVSILNFQNSLFQPRIIIPKGTIPTNILKKIKVVYTLKNTFTETKYFEFQIIKKTMIFNNIQSTLKAPFYRFQEFSVSVFQQILSCDDQGMPTTIQSPVDIIISSNQAPSLSSFSQMGILNSEYVYTISSYSLLSSISITILTQVQMSSDHTIKSDSLLKFDVIPSKLIAKIQGGNRQIDYRSEIIINSTIRDHDIQSELDNQNISTIWKCVDPANDSIICNGNQGQVNLSSGSTTVTISGGTFNPYTVVKIKLIGSKDSRSVEDAIVIIFQEFDLPSLSVNVEVIDPFIKTINLNEEIYIKLNYDTSVNTDILSYSGTVVYDNSVVGIIKFDYVVLRFQLWNIYSQFSRLNSAFSIRFSVFNPNFFMPSIQVIPFNINFPPDNCIFSVNPSSGTLIALTTQFIFSMTGCVDTDLPLSYQFFFYNSAAEYSSEIISPKLIKRKQITDQQSQLQTTTILPAGTLLVMGVVYDSKTAVYNDTKSITINPLSISETSYVSLVSDYIIAQSFSPQQKISQLSIISEDLSQQSTFKSSNINQSKKDLISTMKLQTSQLTTSSSFSSVADKATQSLIASGISYSELEQQETLDSMMLTLNTPISGTFQDVKQDLRKQQLYDYFKVTNSLNEQNNLNEIQNLSSTQTDLTSKIAALVNSNSLPNEDSLVFEGSKLKIYTQKITDKNICLYYFCSMGTQDQSSVQPSIYNLALNTFIENPFSKDPSFQNLTDLLGKQLGSENITTYPVISPFLNDSSNNIVKRKEGISLNFKQIGTKSNLLSCLSKNSTNQWTQSGCKQIYNQETQMFSCICNSLSPTTILDDLESLLENKNLQTAFSSEGLANLSNWTNFYSYAAFWVLLSKTIIFVALYKKGQALDALVSLKSPKSNTKVFPENQAVEKDNFLNEKNQINNESPPSLNIEIEKQNKRKQRSSKKSKFHPEIQVLNLNQKETPISVCDSPNLQEIADIDEVISCRNNGNTDQPQQQTAKSSQEDCGPSKILFNEEVNTITNVNFNLKENIEIQKDKKDNPPPLIKECHIIEFNKLGFIHSILLFHNFFSIFFIYNEKNSRPFRFSVFYIRILHSLSIATIFNSMFSQVQIIALSIVNSALIFVFLKGLEILSNLKRGWKIISQIFLAGLLGFYYYIILSIVSGQEASDSNKAFGSFLILFASDVCVSASIMSLIMRTLTAYMLKKKGEITCSQKIFNFLQLGTILKNLEK